VGEAVIKDLFISISGGARLLQELLLFLNKMNCIFCFLDNDAFFSTLLWLFPLFSRTSLFHLGPYFYAYNYSFISAANTGFEQAESGLMYFVVDSEVCG
jgi:hypothetical protein